jgi:hypothetical protein
VRAFETLSTIVGLARHVVAIWHLDRFFFLDVHVDSVASWLVVAV